VEVDIVMEKAGKVAGIEIKAAATVMKKDFRGLKKLQETTAERFAGGVVVYDGEHVAGFGEKLYAVPIRALWETV
jgi:predicted AAA+ superfamily ATPase